MSTRLASGIGAALVVAGLLLASTQAAVGTTAPLPAETTYSTTSSYVAVHGGHDWRAQLGFSLTNGWYQVTIGAATEAACWFAGGGTGVVAYPDGVSAAGRSYYVVEVKAASGSVEVKCANGHARGPVFATVEATTIRGTP